MSSSPVRRQGIIVPYNPPPLLSLENIKPFAATIAWSATLLAIILAAVALVRWFFPDFRIPTWASMALFAALLIIEHFKIARELWSTDSASLEFEASQDLTRDRVSSALCLAIAALVVLWAVTTFPE